MLLTYQHDIGANLSIVKEKNNYYIIDQCQLLPQKCDGHSAQAWGKIPALYL